MDQYDRQILKLMQQDCSITIDAIAEKIGLSSAAVQRRITKLHSLNIIEREVAVLAQDKLDLSVTVVISVEVERERLDLLDQFKREMRKAPEVQQCYYVTGQTDFLLVVIVKDMREYEKFTHRVFFDNDNIRHFHTNVVMDRVKTGQTLPI